MDNMDNENKPMNQSINEPRESSVGPTIGLVIVLAVIVLGGLYFWGQRSAPEEAADSTATQEETDALVEDISAQSESDASADIEADLESTDIDYVDSELNAS